MFYQISFHKFRHGLPGDLRLKTLQVLLILVKNSSKTEI